MTDTRVEQVRELIRKHFPFDTPNPGQLESIEWVIMAFLKGVRHVVLQAPTGIGKSAIATTIHRVLKALSADHRTTIITATKGLQDQYVEMDRDIYDLKGRSNYKCPYNKGPYNSGQCRAFSSNGGCKKNVECPYIIRRRRWMEDAPLRMSNTSFQVSIPLAMQVEKENFAPLMIIDECHDVDDSIVEHTSIIYDMYSIAFLENDGFINLKNGIQQLIKMFEIHSHSEYFDVPLEITEFALDLSEQTESIIEYYEERITDELLKESEKEKIGDKIEEMGRLKDKLSLFANSMENGKWIIPNWDEKKVEIKPIFAWQVADFVLFQKAKFFLHMSATICGIDEYASTLGLTDFVYGEIPNPIPLNHRKVYYLPKFKINAKFNDYKELGEFIGQLVQRHQPDNGIIHCVSFKLGTDIFQNLPDKSGAFIGKDRNEIVQEMMHGKTGRLCISPSIEKGYDFKGDSSRYQIIAKVPYMYLGDPLIRLNSEYRAGWYARKAILRIVQAAGRSVRGVEDYANTYIIDSSFGRLLNDNREMFPQWFLDSIVEVG